MAKSAYLIFIVILCAVFAGRFKFAWQINQHSKIPTQITDRVGSELNKEGFAYIFWLGSYCVKTKQQAKINIGDLIFVSGSLEEKVTDSGLKEYCLIAETLEIVESFKQVALIEKIYLYQTYLLKSQIGILKNACLSKIAAYFSNHQASVLAGMVLGYKQGLSYSLWQKFQKSSLLHLVVASGGNIALLSGVLITLLNPFFSRKKQIIISYLLIIIYLFLAGFDPPLLRASLMIGLVWLGQVLGRKTTSWWILVLVGLIMLIFEPLLVLSASFQLSFAATAGIVLFGSKVQILLLGFLAKYKDNPILEIFLADGSQTIAAQLLVMPVLLNIFGATNGLSVLANILVAPLVAPLMILGLLFLVLAFTLPFLAQVLSWLLLPLLDWVILMADIFSQQNWSIVAFSLPWIGVFMIWGAILLLFHRYED